MRTPAAFAAARPVVKRQMPAKAASDSASPPDAVAAISAPMLSGRSGFSQCLGPTKGGPVTVMSPDGGIRQEFDDRRSGPAVAQP